MEGLRTVLDRRISNAITQGIPGVVALAANRRGLFYEGAAGVRTIGEAAPMGADSVLTLFSCTKPVTAVAALQLWEDGKLDLDAPAHIYAPELQTLNVLEGFDSDGRAKVRPPRREITTRMLLTHTAGMTYDFLNADYGTMKTGLGAAAGRGRKAELLLPLVFDPGEKWEYSRSIDWAGLVVEAIAGKRLDAVFAERIFSPLGMTMTGYTLTPEMKEQRASMHGFDKSGALVPTDSSYVENPEVFTGGSALMGTARDYMRFLRMWIDGGVGEFGHVLKAETIRYAAQNHMGDLRVGALPAVDPARTRPFEMLPGVEKSWALSFMRLEEDAPTGRPAGSLSWAGLANLYFWIDLENGLVGFWAAQYLPFLHETALNAYLDFESAIYAARSKTENRTS
jgi:methyl acetate hydrolase